MARLPVPGHAGLDDASPRVGLFTCSVDGISFSIHARRPPLPARANGTPSRTVLPTYASAGRLSPPWDNATLRLIVKGHTFIAAHTFDNGERCTTRRMTTEGFL